jgi:hypothetical protein
VILTLGMLSSVEDLVTWYGFTSAALMVFAQRMYTFAHLVLPPACLDRTPLYTVN